MWQRVIGGVSGCISGSFPNLLIHLKSIYPCVVSVGASAFASHGLSSKTEKQQKVFATAANFQLIHSIALAATPAISAGPLGAKVVGGCFGLGMTLFSGSCYASVLTDDKANGKLAPAGGTLLMAGWLALALLRR